MLPAPYAILLIGSYNLQGRSHNLKKVPQIFTEVFNIDNVTANDQHHKEKEINLSSIVITDVKLAS